MHKACKEKTAEMTELDKQLADKLLEQQKTVNKFYSEAYRQCK